MVCMTDKIYELKQEKNAIILAHYYQDEAIQEIADYVGDSLGLARKAAETNTAIIVFAGVHFMAETAKIINPEKKVLLPDLNAGCSLADSCPPSSFSQFVAAHPDHIVITYVNCPAEVKALSDIVCTSSNALRIVNSIPKDQAILFAPDKNLGEYIMKKTGRDLLLWEGACLVHEAFSIEKLLSLAKEYPEAEIIAHPESQSHILRVASFIGSTGEMINYVHNKVRKQFIVATEAGILYKMKQAVPEALLIPAPVDEDNICACSECAFMKLNTLDKLYQCLLNETPEILLDEPLRKEAYRPIKRMLELSEEA